MAPPTFLGPQGIRMDIPRVRKYIDWNPFFALWQLHGKYPNRGYPKIFNDERVGGEAKKLFEDANKLIDTCAAELCIKAAVAFYPAASRGDDIVMFKDESRLEEVGIFHAMRQQTGEAPYMALSDFVAPVGGPNDYIGMFAVTCLGADALAAKYVADHDDYNSIMIKALADRLVHIHYRYLLSY